MQGIEPDGYRIEISGWDRENNFFVEKTELAWLPDGTKKALMRTRLQEGTLVFIRLMENNSAERALPVTYLVAGMSSDLIDGKSEVSLAQPHPRPVQYSGKAFLMPAALWKQSAN